MKYELAKELKDAGFPQGQVLGDQYIWELGTETSGPNSHPRLGIDMFHVGGEYVYVPILEELIEACGDKFDMLQAGQGYWTAWSLPASDASKGSTPTEAVAMLYLALNKKESMTSHLEIAIRDAVRGGWKPKYAKSPETQATSYVQSRILLDKTFWVALGVGRDWAVMESGSIWQGEPRWKYTWHSLIDALAEGGTPESFFEGLAESSPNLTK